MDITEKDKELMERADKATCIDWAVIMNLADDADSEFAKDYILSRGKYLYHLEEYHSGLL